MQINQNINLQYVNLPFKTIDFKEIWKKGVFKKEKIMLMISVNDQSELYKLYHQRFQETDYYFAICEEKGKFDLVVIKTEGRDYLRCYRTYLEVAWSIYNFWSCTIFSNVDFITTHVQGDFSKILLFLQRLPLNLLQGSYLISNVFSVKSSEGNREPCLLYFENLYFGNMNNYSCCQSGNLYKWSDYILGKKLDECKITKL